MDGMKAHWEQEKEAIDAIRALKAEIEQVKGEAERAERDGDLARPPSSATDGSSSSRSELRRLERSA